MNNANRQADLFGKPQTDLFDNLPADQGPDEAQMRAMVRPRLAALLAQARAASRMPWDAKNADINAIIFHNMANWLPEAERDELRAAFKAELARLAV